MAKPIASEMLSQSLSEPLTGSVATRQAPATKRSGRVGTGRGGTTFLGREERKGTHRLSEFNSAPASVQAAFYKQLAAELERERSDDAWLATQDLSPQAPHVLTQWDDSWTRRARAVRKAAECFEDDWTPNRDDDPLRDIPARVYVEALTGEEVPHSGSMSCPLPDHDDRNPSFRVYSGTGWRCFGCGQSGSIYDLSAALWGMSTRGREFRELHRRLRGVFR